MLAETTILYDYACHEGAYAVPNTLSEQGIIDDPTVSTQDQYSASPASL